MNLTLFLMISFILQMLCLWIGNQSSKSLKNQEDYFLAGKTISFFPLMMTFIATQIGGGLVLGAAEEAYHFGWTVLLYPIGASLGFLLLASGIGRKMAQFRVTTVAQLFEVVYRSSLLKKLASLLSIISLFMILVAQFIASKKFMISLGVDSHLIFVLFWAIVIVYTVLGGLKAVIATDVVQAAFFIFVFLMGFGYVFFAGDVTFNQTWQAGWDHQQFEWSSSKLCGWLLMPLLFMVIEQDMGQRCFAAESPKVVSRAAGWAAFCIVAVCLVPVYFGVLGKNLNLLIPEGSSVLMTVIEATANPLIAALVGCAVLAAIISTADSLINAISSNLSQDFDLAIFKKPQTIKTAQALTAGIALLGLVFSFSFNNVVDLLIQSYELSVCCLFIPVFAALFKRQGSSLSAGLAIAFGAAGFVVFKFVDIPFPKEIASVLLSGMGYFVGELAQARRLYPVVEETHS